MKTLTRTLVLGLVAATLVACSSGGDSATSSPDTSSSVAATEATASGTASGTAAASSSAEAQGSDEELTEPLDIVTAPYTAEELQLAQDNVLTFMNALYSGDYTTACFLGVDSAWSSIRAVLGGAELEACIDGAAQEMASTGIDFSEMQLTPEQVVVEDAGDGFANVSLNGTFQGMQVVKLSDGKIYIDIASMRG